MKTEVTYGTYGERQIGATSTQIMVTNGEAFVVCYTFERWSDILGSIDVLSIERMVDEFGAGNVSLVNVTDTWTYDQVNTAFRAHMVLAVRTAMGLS